MHDCLHRGTEEYFGLDNKVDIINSTLGKALGGAAGQGSYVINFLSVLQQGNTADHSFEINLLQS